MRFFDFMKTPRSKLRGIRRKMTLNLLEASFGESHPKRLKGFVFFVLVAIFASVQVVSADPPGDSVTGAGTSEGREFFGDFLHFTVSAHSGPNGEEPRGNIVFRFLDPDDEPVWPGGKPRSADILCLLVDGNDAVVIAEFKKGDQPFGPGFPYLALVMRDHGVPGQGFADLGFASATTTSNCNDIQFWIDDFAVPLISGNITISDATP